VVSKKKLCGEFKGDFLFLINLTTPITSSGFKKQHLKMDLYGDAIEPNSVYIYDKSIPQGKDFGRNSDS
jgi:hypothetical protein